MEVRVLKEGKKALLIEVDGLGHSFFNALVDQLNSESSVENAAYTIRHPLIGKPQLLVETNGKVSPRKAILDAVKKLKKTNAKMKQQLSSILK